MKKIIQLIATFFLLINTAYAQYWELAPKIGYHNQVSGDLQFGRHGFDIGLGGTYNFSRKFAVEADAMYSLVKEFSFINVPIKAKYYIIKGFNVFAGPQFNFYLNNKPIMIQDGGKPQIPRSFLFAAMGGIGYKFESGYSISFSYNYSMTETYVNDRTKNNFDSKNMQGAKVTFAKYFKLGK